MEHKANTFSDFIACGRPPDRTGHRPPGSRWRPGAARPAACSSAPWPTGRPSSSARLVAEVPFVDCVTTMLDDELPLTVGEWEEWGNPLADEAAYRRMLTYSPYDNVPGRTRTDRRAPTPTFRHRRAEQPPGRLLEAGEVGGQAAAESPTTRVLLRTELGAGHGGPSGRYDAWKEEALVYAFLLDALGAGRRGD